MHDKTDYEQIAKKISNFIKNQISDAGAKGAVFGLSGGIDSAVTASLCTHALGKERCIAVIMPHGKITIKDETSDGLEVAAMLDIRHYMCDIDMTVSSLKQAASIDGNKISSGNLLARARASLLYYYANTLNYLVVGTDDKSEYLMGYFTKFGDGASDILPIRDLYKTEVQKLGEYLNIPSKITGKQPGPHLWTDHYVLNEIGFGYDIIDKILCAYFDEKIPADQLSHYLQIDQASVDKILSLHQQSEHKRNLQPFCRM